MRLSVAYNFYQTQKYNILIAPAGIEPTSKVPETFVLSIERRSPVCAYSYTIPLFCQEQRFGSWANRNRTKMRAPNVEKGDKRFIVWRKIVYHNVCMINTDKGQEGIANSH